MVVRRFLPSAGVVFSLAAASVVAARTFARPRSPFAAYPAGRWIGLIYLVLFLAGGVLVWRGSRRGSGVFAALLAAGLFALTLWTPAPRWSFLLLLWICWIAWGLGGILLKRSGFARSLAWLEGLALGLPLGWGALMVLTLLLGIWGLYYRWVFYILLLALSALVVINHQERKRMREGTQSELLKLSLCSFVSFVVVLILVGGSYLWALAPAVRYDAVSYHLAAPARYLQAGRMIELPESFQTYSAHYGEMLYTLALGVGEQPLPGMLSFAAGLLLAVQTYLLGRRLAGQRVGWLAALLLLATPLAGMEMATAYTDVFLGVFVTAAVLAFSRWLDAPETRWLLLMGVFSGLALGTKLNAFFLLLPIWIWVITTETRSSQRKTDSPCSLCLRGVYVFLPALLLLFPWLLRDYLWTGNPIFPNYNQLFRSPEWFVRPFFRVQPTAAVGLRILAFPWAGVFDSYRYYHEAPGAALGALPLLGLPWFYLRRRKLPALGLAFLASLVMIFAYGGSARYLFPLFPVLSVLAAANLDALWARWQGRRVAALLLALLGVYLFSTRLAFTARWWEAPERSPVRLLIGRQSPADFIEGVLPVYGALEYLDSRGEFKVFSVGNELRLYTRSAIYGVMMSKEAYEILHQARSPGELADSLAATGYDYLLIYRPEQDFRPEIYTAPALNDVFLAADARQVYARRGVELYQLTVDN